MALNDIVCENIYLKKSICFWAELFLNKFVPNIVHVEKPIDKGSLRGQNEDFRLAFVPFCVEGLCEPVVLKNSRCAVFKFTIDQKSSKLGLTRRL
ncbi:hypothetical protein L596_004804 [Steinernema carpocapsae]|uniref:Uncharacterized protein n=1 Tax=Steinernema carpocapsae TaxID=34508 RepID=A0A4U8UX24_STECR|nr:hypothetical protein L596_004804 [Steinernema carpocapsae]